MERSFSVVNKTKSDIPRLPLSRLKYQILGRDYALSLAYITKTKSREINRIYRNKNKPANVLSFPFSKNFGEILICPAVLSDETKKFNKSFRQLLMFLIVHGMLHLKGMKHGKKMEREEKKYIRK